MNLHDIKSLAERNRKANKYYGIINAGYSDVRKRHSVHMTQDSFIESAEGQHVTVSGQRFQFIHDGTEYFTLVNDDLYEEFEERFFPDIDDEVFTVDYKTTEQQLQTVGMSQKDFI